MANLEGRFSRGLIGNSSQEWESEDVLQTLGIKEELIEDITVDEDMVAGEEAVPVEEPPDVSRSDDSTVEGKIRRLPLLSPNAIPREELGNLLLNPDLGTVSEADHEVSGDLKCLDCGFIGGSKQRLNIHLLSHSGHRPNCFHCPNCYFNTKLRNCSSLQLSRTRTCTEWGSAGRHEPSSSDNIFPHSLSSPVCSGCSYDLSKRGSQDFRSSSSAKLSHVSRLCQTGSLKNPCLNKLDSKLFECGECDFKCEEVVMLNIHSLCHSDSKLVQYFWGGGKVGRNRLGTKLFRCSECAYECSRKHQLNAHVLAHSCTKTS